MNRRSLRFMAVFCACLGLVAAPAAASEIGGAKTAGHAGEQLDGYVGVVSGAPASVSALVERVNAGRRAKYAEIAAKNGLDVGVVAAQAGAKLVERAPAGQYVRDASGWRKK